MTFCHLAGSCGSSSPSCPLTFSSRAPSPVHLYLTGCCEVTAQQKGPTQARASSHPCSTHGLLHTQENLTQQLPSIVYSQLIPASPWCRQDGLGSLRISTYFVPYSQSDVPPQPRRDQQSGDPRARERPRRAARTALGCQHPACRKVSAGPGPSQQCPGGGGAAAPGPRDLGPGRSVPTPSLWAEGRWAPPPTL